MDNVISRLEASGVRVETVETYLLDSAHHKIRVPCTLNGVPVQIGFSASIPAWTARVRAHLTVCFAGSRRWSVYEQANGFPVTRIVSRINKELELRTQEEISRLERLGKQRLAEEKLEGLATALGVAMHGPLVARQSNVELVGLADSPQEVYVTIRTSHANASKITQYFRELARVDRKA